MTKKEKHAIRIALSKFKHPANLTNVRLKIALREKGINLVANINTWKRIWNRDCSWQKKLRWIVKLAEYDGNLIIKTICILIG